MDQPDQLPSGQVTFFFTDVVGSTRLWAQQPDSMSVALQIHDHIMNESLSRHQGAVFALAGDSFAAAFAHADAAVRCATEIQSRLHTNDWGDLPTLQVRIGMHRGVAEERDGNFFGPPVNQAARVMSVAHGGQSIITDSVRTDTQQATIDLGSHLLRDIETPVHLHQVGEGAFPPLATRQVGAASLPSPRTSLVGRLDEVKAIRSALDASKLLTLIGVGGCGKTRLAIEVAHRQSPLNPGGLWFVDLTSASAGEVVAASFVRTFGLSLPAGASAVDEIATYLAPRTALLVVDNCEHVVDSVADIVDELLERCPHLRVLATSREALSVPGEFTWRVPSLPTNAESAGVALFVERAIAAGAEVGLDDVTIAQVSEVVERLDGNPLAIELTAAMARSLDIVQIRDRLDDRFTLLASGTQRRRQEHQSTLEGAVQWSYDLLDEREQLMLRTLSVFRDGFEVDDAAAVSEFDDVGALRLLTALVEKSLVDVTRDDAGLLRHRLLETIRLFARQRSVAADEFDAVRDRHLAHFGGDAVLGTYHAWASLKGIERIRREYENFREAATWAIERGRPVDAARIAAILSDAAAVRGEEAQMVEWMRLPTALDAYDRVLVNSFLGWALLMDFETDNSLAALDDAIAASDDVDFDFAVGALLYKALWASIRGEVDIDRAAMDAAEELATTRYPGNARGTVAVARSARLATQFRYADIVDVCEACLSSAPDYGYRHVIESFRAWALLRAGRVDEAAAAVESFVPIPRGSRWQIMNLSASIVVTAHVSGVEAATARLAHDGYELVSRRPEMDQQILGCFAYLAHLRGDDARVEELVPSIVTAGGLGIAHWVQFERLGATSTNADEVIAAFNDAHPLEERLAARDANRARHLAEELARASAEVAVERADG